MRRNMLFLLLFSTGVVFAEEPVKTEAIQVQKEGVQAQAEEAKAQTGETQTLSEKAQGQTEDVQTQKEQEVHLIHIVKAITFESFKSTSRISQCLIYFHPIRGNQLWRFVLP